MKLARSLLAFVAIAAVATPARAAKYDVSLRKFGTPAVSDGTLTVDLDGVAWRDYVRDVGVAMAPKLFGPADTLGSLGFFVGVELSFTDINEGADYWKRAVGNPDSTLRTIQFRVRKGLPFSTELGGSVTHLFDSSMWGVGIDLKFAPVEGYEYIPDVAFRANVHTVLGARDMTLLLTGGDVTVSKEFGVAGVLRITPYGGYNLVFIHGESHPVTFFSPDPGCIPAGGGTANCSRVELFGNTNQFVHRAIVGFRLVAAYVSTGFELAYAGAHLLTYSIHLGVDF